jgi:hypothetical protein
MRYGAPGCNMCQCYGKSCLWYHGYNSGQAIQKLLSKSEGTPSLERDEMLSAWARCFGSMIYTDRLLNDIYEFALSILCAAHIR